MIKNKNFIKLLISFTCILGFFNLYGTIGMSYFSLYISDNDAISYVIGASNLASIIACLIVSGIIDKYKIYKKVFLILNLTGIVCQILLTVFLELIEDKDIVYILFFITWTIISMSIIPIYSCSMDFVCELTYPVGESISGGFIMSCTQISGIIAVN
jgi:Na+/melibiose symporter-like transporter